MPPDPILVLVLLLVLMRRWSGLDLLTPVWEYEYEG